MGRVFIYGIEREWETRMKGFLSYLLQRKEGDISFGRDREVLSKGEISLSVHQEEKREGLLTISRLMDSSKRVIEYQSMDEEIRDPLYQREDYLRRCLARREEGFYRVLTCYLPKELSPWGVLKGVRPTKLVHMLLDKGLDVKRIKYLLNDLYCLSRNKQELLLKCALFSYQIISSAAYEEGLSIYIHIPFCFSRCTICSFFTEVLGDDRSNLSSYLLALKEEIWLFSQLMKRANPTIYSIYIGGGTPSILQVHELEMILKALKEAALIPKYEFTIEAGRPEGITQETLEIMLSYGVNRISINPQTVWEKTLKEIGRDHSYAMIEEAYYLARSLGFPVINLDLILGLPREGPKEVRESLERVLSLNPNSITVHSLAKKRMALRKYKEPSGDVIKEMVHLRDSLLQEKGFIPYYLYRQKEIMGWTENVGYSKDGLFSYFNLAMMEERQTVIGLGCRAVTKLIHPIHHTMDRWTNPVLPSEYGRLLEIVLAKKRDRLTKFWS